MGRARKSGPLGTGNITTLYKPSLSFRHQKMHCLAFFEPAGFSVCLVIRHQVISVRVFSFLVSACYDLLRTVNQNFVGGALACLPEINPLVQDAKFAVLRLVSSR